MRTPETVVARSSSGGVTGGRVGLAKGTKLVAILALMLVRRRGRGNVTSNGSREARGVAESDPGVGGLSRSGITDTLPHRRTDDGAVATELGHQIIDRDVVGQLLDQELEGGPTCSSADADAHLVPGRRDRGVRGKGRRWWRRHLGPSMVRLHGDGGLESTVRSRGRHTDTGVVAGVIVVVMMIGRHERATTIGPKATATAATVHHLAPLLGLLDLTFLVVYGDMNARPAHHSDGIVALLRQIGDVERSYVGMHGNEAKAAAGTCVAIEDQSDSFDLCRPTTYQSHHPGPHMYLADDQEVITS